MLTNSERVTFSLCSFVAQFVGQRKSDEVAEHTDGQAVYSHRRFQQAIPYQHARGTGYSTGQESGLCDPDAQEHGRQRNEDNGRPEIISVNENVEDAANLDGENNGENAHKAVRKFSQKQFLPFGQRVLPKRFDYIVDAAGGCSVEKGVC